MALIEQLSPIVLFVYNRPWHTEQTLEALAKNELADQSTLYVFADGPKPGASGEDLKKIEDTRAVIRKRAWCKEVILNESDHNKGLANSVIEGVTQVVNQHGKVIVLEDDIITSPYFLQYLNEGLEMYQESKNVIAINSYMFPIQTDRVDTFLSPLATSTWGWATWADRWAWFEKEPRYKNLIQRNPFLRSRFNLADYNYAVMLDNKNSWGIRWYYSAFLRNSIGLFPTKTLSNNIGFGEDATHTKASIEQCETFRQSIALNFKEYIDFDLHNLLLEHFTSLNVREKPFRIFASRLKKQFVKMYRNASLLFK
jgi:hypothetical protein